MASSLLSFLCYRGSFVGESVHVCGQRDRAVILQVTMWYTSMALQFRVGFQCSLKCMWCQVYQYTSAFVSWSADCWVCEHIISRSICISFKYSIYISYHNISNSNFLFLLFFYYHQIHTHTTVDQDCCHRRPCRLSQCFRTCHEQPCSYQA